MNTIELLDKQSISIPQEAKPELEAILKHEKANGCVSVFWLMARAYILGYLNGKRADRQRHKVHDRKTKQ